MFANHIDKIQKNDLFAHSRGYRYEKECEFCEKIFKAKYKNARFCSQNCCDKDKYETAKFTKARILSFIPGITWDICREFWKVNISSHGLRTYIGWYKNFTDAYCARLFAIEIKNKFKEAGIW